MLGLSHVGDIVTSGGVLGQPQQSVSRVSGFPCFIRKIELGVGRVVAKAGHSLFGGLQLSTQAKRCEMRPHPASKKTEGGRARLG